MAECLYNDMSKDGARAYSAGSHPTGQVNPLTLAVLAENGHNTDGFRSKSWDEFTEASAPKIDLVITVCDNAAGEVCPIWPGRPAKFHVGFPDPAAAEGTPEHRMEEFRKVYALIKAKIQCLVELGPQSLEAQ